MQDNDYLLFGEERWALAQRWIVRVEGVNGEETPRPLSLSAWGIEEQAADTSGHILRLETSSSKMSLLVYGRLKSLRVKSEQVIDLPLQFFAASPATALIFRDDHRTPALLLDPARLDVHLLDSRSVTKENS